jgi:hypothetical protein
MSGTSDIVNLIDQIMTAPKRIVGADMPPRWSESEWQGEEITAQYPLEVDGEIQGSRFFVVGIPDAIGVQFRLGILTAGCVCRLDYTDETHGNTEAVPEDDVPPIVTGAHYHTWEKNRRFFSGLTKAPRLRNAVAFELRASFDSVLRWFCADTNISPLPPGHRIQLPLRTRIL